MNTHTMLDTDDDLDSLPAPYAGPWTVTIVLADLACGGPEEGGWYYQTFDPTAGDAVALDQEWQATRTFWDEREANAYCQELDDRCQRQNAEERRPEKSSVLSRGRYEAYCFDGFPQPLPIERPHYE
jgi:hypothetical protein